MQTYINGIQAALQREIAETPDYAQFKVESVKVEGGVWRLVLLPKNNASKLDESLEGNNAWWANTEKGSAQVLSVIPEDSEVHLRYVKGAKPVQGDDIRIYAADFLKSLRDYWQSDINSQDSIKWLLARQANNIFIAEHTLNTNAFPDLREKQKEAFKLPGWQLGFLWGPPGTGKTYTLGTMLAQFLIQFPKKRILLLSTTNNAVDLALVSVDQALEHLGKTQADAELARNKCKRLGHNFVSAHYKNRQHLLPVQDKRLLHSLHELETKEPDKREVILYKKWKEEVERIREIIRVEARQALWQSRLAALTTTRAIFTLDDLKTFPFDLVIFDEASQVSIAHSLSLAPLGKSCIFAGDFKQLSPISVTKGSYAKDWLMSSMFKYMKKGDASTVILDEQSRMCQKICNLIRDVFYQETCLKVASDVENDRAWLTERMPCIEDSLFSKPLSIIPIDKPGVWSQKYGGNIRYESAQACVGIAEKYVTANASADLLILTPYRAQRNLIKALLRRAKCHAVKVSTVHKAQGGERHTIIFDPVSASDKFLMESYNSDAKKLLNVALSRAKASIIVPLSESDRKNPLYSQLYTVAVNADKVMDYKELEYYLELPGFPSNCKNKIVRYGSCLGRVLGVVNDDGKPTLNIEDFNTGVERRFYITALINKFHEKKLIMKTADLDLINNETKPASPKNLPPEFTLQPKSHPPLTNQIGTLTCPVCHSVHLKHTQLQEHIRKEHLANLDDFTVCDNCGVHLKLKNYAKHCRLKHASNPDTKPQLAKLKVKKKRINTPKVAQKKQSTPEEKALIASYLKRNPEQKKY